MDWNNKNLSFTRILYLFLWTFLTIQFLSHPVLLGSCSVPFYLLNLNPLGPSTGAYLYFSVLVTKLFTQSVRLSTFPMILSNSISISTFLILIEEMSTYLGWWIIDCTCPVQSDILAGLFLDQRILYRTYQQ